MYFQKIILLTRWCFVGMREGDSIIVNELNGEKIDIIKWTEDLPSLI